MLAKCPECGNDVSSQASSCPKCGHPVAAPPQAAPASATPAAKKKVSHSAGWISLAAFVFANFTPALLAPILVLVALIFAAKELSAGGKVFGSVVLALALLQGWFVIDHFGHISGSLGLVTAEDADKQAAAKYANASQGVPGDWKQVAQAKCAQEWPSDYRMRNYCVKQQTEGTYALDRGRPSDVDSTAFRVIRGKCAEEWPRDFRMRAYCESQQVEGYRALKSISVGSSTRNACAQQWPTDYKMRRYCENRGS